MPVPEHHHGRDEVEHHQHPDHDPVDLQRQDHRAFARQEPHQQNEQLHDDKRQHEHHDHVPSHEQVVHERDVVLPGERPALVLVGQAGHFAQTERNCMVLR